VVAGTGGHQDGGAIGDGGPPAGERPSDATGPAACPGLLCEDFEGGPTLDRTRWTTDVGYNPANAVTVESDMVRSGSGTYAGHAHVDPSEGGFARLKESQTFPALADALWGRASFYTTVAASTGHTAFVSVFIGSGAAILEIGQSTGTWQLTYYDPNGAEAPQANNAQIPRSRWVCLEFHFVRAPATGAPLIEVFIDGALADSYLSAGQTLPPFTALGLGVEDHSASAPGDDVFLDDIAIGATRMGCPAP
jgi:hypothetical protein